MAGPRALRQSSADVANTQRMTIVAQDVPDLPPEKEEQAAKRESTTADVTYEVIRRQGEHELERETSALAWSGIAAR